VWAERPQGGAADSPGWVARAVPNLYPVLSDASEDGEDPAAMQEASGESGLAAAADPLAASRRGAEPSLFASQPAAGAHEVIVSCPEHFTRLCELPAERLASAVAAWRERMRAHEDAAYVHLIVNEGPDAGASLEHTHAQLYAMRFVPATVARERERATAYHERTMGGHLLAEVATEEVRRRDRLVAVDDDALLIAPWASRSPFELRVIPRRPAPSFEQDGEAGTAMIATALRALASAFDEPPQLNLWIRTAPRGAEEFCWHIDIVPRLTIRAGFEFGTGVDINVYPPERAASDLREVLGV
jgi:UDPglucose--hexose-1-phosphate uridylyltransferase